MRARCTLPIKTPALRKRGPPARLPSPRLDHSRIGSASGAGFFTTRRINPAFKSRCRGEKSRNFVPTFRLTDRILHPFPRYSHPPIIPHFAWRHSFCARERGGELGRSGPLKKFKPYLLSPTASPRQIVLHLFFRWSPSPPPGARRDTPYLKLDYFSPHFFRAAVPDFLRTLRG